MAIQHFQDKKSRILRQLNVPSVEYTDASPKGSIDEPIRELVDHINSIPNLVTTSSCSGRISVYVEGKGKSFQPASDATPEQASSTSGKGGGKWTFVSHEPISSTYEASESKGSLHTHFGLQQAIDHISWGGDPQCSLVHFKFEPMILHILTASPSDAQQVLSAALQAGFRESGATSLESSPMVAVRSSGLMFDSIIGYQDRNDQLLSIVNDEYLSLLVAIANQRFAVNRQRIRRFTKALTKAFTKTHNYGCDESNPPNHDRTARREENRRQGQLRQAQQRASAQEAESVEAPWTDSTLYIDGLHSQDHDDT